MEGNSFQTNGRLGDVNQGIEATGVRGYVQRRIFVVTYVAGQTVEKKAYSIINESSLLYLFKICVPTKMFSPILKEFN